MWQENRYFCRNGEGDYLSFNKMNFTNVLMDPLESRDSPCVKMAVVVYLPTKAGAKTRYSSVNERKLCVLNKNIKISPGL